MIQIRTHITLPHREVFHLWTDPQHIKQWNAASDDWHCPEAENDLKAGGRFCYVMASKDGKMSFPFEGHFTDIQGQSLILSELNDGRKTSIHFHPVMDGTEVTQRFEPETENDIEQQKQGWQAILDNFKRYAESI